MHYNVRYIFDDFVENKKMGFPEKLFISLKFKMK